MVRRTRKKSNGDMKNGEAMALVRDGILQIPLFHGTSAMFESSLRRFGLGGKDRIKQMQVLDLFKEVVALCELYLPEDNVWQMRSIYAYDIVAEKPTHGNWRYGGVYLTPSKGRAITHARHNRYGSELLSIIEPLIRRIEVCASREYRDLAKRYAAVFNLFTKKQRPLLVEAHGVPLTLLKAEDGGAAEVVLQKAELFIDFFLHEEVGVPLGFELPGILPRERFAIVHL